MKSTARRIVVIGGSAAGPKAASRARRLDPLAEITIVQKSEDFSMGSCGYPFFVGGHFDDRNKLISTPTGVIRNSAFFEKAKAIKALNLTEATKIDREKKKVICRKINEKTKETFALDYDKLIITTGASPIKPPIPGIDLSGVTTLQSMADADYLRTIRDNRSCKEAVIIGGGLIGVEVCEALQLSDIQTTIVEMLPQVLAFLDWELATLVKNHIESKGAKVVLSNPVASFEGSDTLEAVVLKDGQRIPCQLAIVATGVRPNISLAKEAGLEIGRTGGIIVDEYLATSDPDIYAAGDCVELPHLVNEDKVHAPYGDLANLEGRVAACNVVEGNKTKFPGTLHTGVCKVFDWNVGATGLSEKSAQKAGLEIETVLVANPDKPSFMGGQLLYVKLVADKRTGKLLGAQCLGPGDASKRVAQAAVALRGGLTVTDVTTLDLPYAPPYSPAIDNFITAAHVLENKMNGHFESLSCKEVKEKLESKEKPFLLDTRGEDEYEQMRLGVGETLIPLGALRERLNELPEDKGSEIICYCKVSARGYEALRFLQGIGYANVKIMEGGVMAWPFPREK